MRVHNAVQCYEINLQSFGTKFCSEISCKFFVQNKKEVHIWVDRVHNAWQRLPRFSCKVMQTNNAVFCKVLMQSDALQSDFAHQRKAWDDLQQQALYERSIVWFWSKWQRSVVVWYGMLHYGIVWHSLGGVTYDSEASGRKQLRYGHTSYLSFFLHNRILRCGNFTLESA